MPGKAGRSGRQKGAAPSASPPSLEPMSDLSPPVWLNDVARDKWLECIDILTAVPGLATDLDRGILGQYCEAYAEFMAASDQLGTDYVVTSRAGAPYQNPLLGVKNKALDRMLRAGDRLGMNPQSRSSMKLTPAPPANAEMDRFAAIFKMRVYDPRKDEGAA